MEKAIARILGRNGKPVGVGFLAEDDVILTCAHVVTDAMGLPRHKQDKPTQPLLVDFPLLDNTANKPRLITKVAAWRAYDDMRGGDIAGLQLSQQPPPGAVNVPIKIKTSLWKQQFRAFGVPVGYDAGVWATGEILGRQSNGFFQIQSTAQTGYRIQPGFSGGPVWSEQMNAVVAMLAIADKSDTARVAFAIPARMLIEVIAEATETSAHTVTYKAASKLGELVKHTTQDLTKLAQREHIAASQPNADTEDLLGAALPNLLLARYGTAEQFFRRIYQQEPLNGYAAYGLVLCLLSGQRPAALQNFTRSREIHNLINQAVAQMPSAHAFALSFYIKYDYFQRNGFSTYASEIDQDAEQARQMPLDIAELEALARILPDIKAITLYKELI
jgi:hypothetical protein